MFRVFTNNALSALQTKKERGKHNEINVIIACTTAKVIKLILCKKYNERCCLSWDE